MKINRNDIGYTIYSRLEEALRSFVVDKLMTLFGDRWLDHIPIGIQEKVRERLTLISFDKEDDPTDFLQETDFIDLSEIVTYKKNFLLFIQEAIYTQGKFQDRMLALYDLRCKIAHVKQYFTAIDLDLLIEISEEFLKILNTHGEELRETLECIKTNPESVVIQIPADFFFECDLRSQHLHNLPPSDYDADGGFIGRVGDLKKINSLVLGDLDRVVTISGAGGVGKTALAHKFCVSLLQQSKIPFDAIIWISAKEEKLTLTGIEPIEPTVRNYEEMLDSILSVFGWFNEIAQDLDCKKGYVDLILRECDSGILLVVDNLETIQDDRILNFIKDMPRPNKVLITSRMGLGEVERRYSLKEMAIKDAIALIRAIAREKGAESLVRLSDDVLRKYAIKMAGYPLAIKWVIGQVALGKDIDQLVDSITSTSGDIAQFCFEHIYNYHLSDKSRMILCCLAASDGPLTRGVLTHISGLPSEELDIGLRDLNLASLVIPEQQRGNDDTVVTIYALLPLTVGYLKAKLQSQPDVWKSIKARMEVVGSRIEESVRAGKQYRYALQDLGATTDEERIAASWALTAYQRSQMGDYLGAVEGFKRAVEIAPNFSRIYRNWAVAESTEGYYERAYELLKKATNLAPDDPTLWFVWGNIEKRRGRLDKSRQFFMKAHVLSPNDGAVLGGLGEVEKRSGNYKEANDYFQKALEVPSEVQGYKHELVTYTAIADNLRRWSEELSKNDQIDIAIDRAKLAYNCVSRVIKEEGSDRRAVDTLHKVSFQLANLLSKKQGIEEALPYFKQAIVKNPKRIKDKKISSLSYYHLSRSFLFAGKIEEAKRYYQLGEKIRPRTPSDRQRYNDLYTELFEERFVGKLLRVISDKGYGFIEREDATGQTIFVHITNFASKLTTQEFESLQGGRVSFSIQETERGPEANNVRLTS